MDKNVGKFVNATLQIFFFGNTTTIMKKIPLTEDYNSSELCSTEVC